MNANRNVLPHSYGSDFALVDAHEIQPEEYEEIPEMADDAITSGTLKAGGRPIYSYQNELVTLHLPANIFERWLATGPGWEQRMTARLSTLKPSHES
ncbi:hypothetical protein GJ697_07055 [Pseudoduganella sp. FT25W]|uniref:Uncharacterized protein n=1 Tax=Duganella alba TaxID=2666081 RepID=A0A6L5QCW4_9BURK|nr:hypothetical protein [Duganella alba]MRX07585.1 hypothetical protein [Duganella alba]MRX15970.1 hypothetical protein [Duganella alba]